MSLTEIMTALADKIVSHLGVKVRYSVQVEHRDGNWVDLNQTWTGAKKAPYSVTRTVADARLWENRYQAALVRNLAPARRSRVVRQVTQFDVVA